MDNTVVHILLPKGLALTNGSTLAEDAEFMVLGNVTPWYASVDQVRLEGGIYLPKLSDITIAAQIWQASKDADVIGYVAPAPPQPGAAPTDYNLRIYNNYMHARNQWVTQRAALDTITRSFDLVGTRGSKSLGGFSVMKMAFGRDEGLPRLTTEMEKEINKWKIVIQSGGKIGFGGHALPVMAAKGLMDPEVVPGRLWSTTGMGAQFKSPAGAGSRGAPIKFGSPTFIDWRVGRQYGNYVSLFPTVIWS